MFSRFGSIHGMEGGDEAIAVRNCTEGVGKYYFYRIAVS
jgi:hypothetical protein